MMHVESYQINVHKIFYQPGDDIHRVEARLKEEGYQLKDRCHPRDGQPGWREYELRQDLKREIEFTEDGSQQD